MRLLAGIVFCGVMAVAGLVSAGEGSVRTVEITIENSAYRPDVVEISPGETVEFVLVNHDPISHEFILGSQSVQLEHEEGTESYHGEIPTEVTVGPNTRVTTTVTFDGSYGIELGEQNFFACHLPGHFDYGMVGRIAFD